MKSYSIYQIKDDATNARYIKYSGLDFVKENDLCTMSGDLCKLDSDLYEKVYEGQTEVGEDEEAIVTLEYLYMKFQGRKPEGYTGHSLSVSDVVVLDGTAYYVDNYGFEEIDF